MKPTQSALIDMLAGVLSGVPATGDGFLSEAEVAETVGLDPRRLRALRAAAIVAPRRVGRGFVYTSGEARLCAVAATLLRMGTRIEELAALFGEADRCRACPGRDGPCAPRDCCAALLDVVAARAEREIAALRRFDRLLGLYADRDTGLFPQH